jgi:Glycosyl hydrolase family 12
MRRPLILRRCLAVLALVAAVVGLGSAAADARGLARTCRHPAFVTSGWEGQGFGRYYADSDMWNADGYTVTQRMRVCSPGNWSVSVSADNSSGDGAVKTYPNVHRDYHDWSNGHEPRLSSFASITSRFASRSPDVGIYDGAYDIWLNGVADDDSTELMIWTDNHRQVPAGRVVERGVRFSHRTWRLWATADHHYLAFVPGRSLRHGTIALRKRFSYLVAHDYVPHRSTLGQVCFGYEIVSTKGTLKRFKIDRFSVTSSRT